jgi:hypothetical protein
MVPSHGQFSIPLDTDLLGDHSEQFEMEDVDYHAEVEELHLNEAILKIDFLNFLMDHLPYFFVLNDFEKANVYFSFLSKTDNLPLERDQVKVLSKTSGERGYFFTEEMDDRYFGGKWRLPQTDQNLKVYNKYINDFSDKYLGKSISTLTSQEINRMKRSADRWKSSDHKDLSNLFKKVKLTRKQYMSMTDSPYALKGKLLDYHWGYINMHYDFRLILPYSFMPEGYRTLDIQNYFSPCSVFLLKKYAYSRSFFSLQNFTAETDYFMSLELENENYYKFFNKPIFSKFNQLKIIKMVKR